MIEQRTEDERTIFVRITDALREKLNDMADQIFVVGHRCHHSRTGREVRPHQMALLEAAWEVAQRHPDEFTMAVMRRTEPRTAFGIQTTKLARGQRPR